MSEKAPQVGNLFLKKFKLHFVRITALGLSLGQRRLLYDCIPHDYAWQRIRRNNASLR